MPNLAKRLISAAILIPSVVAVVWLGPAWSIAALAVLCSVLCGFEFAAICFAERKAAFKALFAGLCGIVSFAVSISAVFPHAPLVALLAAAPAGLAIFLFSKPAPFSATATVTSGAFAALGLVYCGALLGCISLLYPVTSLCSLSAPPGPAEGRLWILLLLSGVIASDTFAYASGRLFGVRKLAPHISPGKTWAGAFGSVFGTTLAVVLFALFLLPGLHPAAAAALGLALSVFGQIGDLCESLLKRGFSVKDSGRLIPGHGGVLDRLDSLMFGAPIVLLFSWLR
jgi:phosphatidate cytidylyltransferase